MTPEQALETIKALGGRLADLFDLALGDINGGGFYFARTWREQPAFEALMRRHPLLLSAAITRMTGDIRGAAIGLAGAKDMLGDPAFAPMLMEAVAGKPGSKETEAALSGLAALEPAVLRELIAPALAKSGGDARFSLVQAAIRNGSDLLKDVLRDHLPREKTARIRAAIEAVVDITPAGADDAVEQQAADGANGYAAVDGRWIEIPPMSPLAPAAAHARTAPRIQDDRC